MKGNWEKINRFIGDKGCMGVCDCPHFSGEK